MYISDFGMGVELKLEVNGGTMKMEFASKVTGVTDKKYRKMLDVASKGYPYAIVEAFRKDGMIVNFPPKGMSYKVIFIEPSTTKVFEFVNVVVKPVMLPTGEKLHILISPSEMKELNRRENFRLWLGCSGVAQIGIHNENFDIIIKDISAIGVSFILENKQLENMIAKPKESTPVVLTFHDDTIDKTLKLNATIVRIEEADEMRTLYGCKFKKESDVITKLINEKQRERAKVNHNKKPEKEKK